MNFKTRKLKITYYGLDLLLTAVEQTPFFAEKGIGKKFRIEFLGAIKIRNIEFEEKFQKALYGFRKEYGVRLVTVSDLINTDYRLFLTQP
jgi:hypothetical protein